MSSSHSPLVKQLVNEFIAANYMEEASLSIMDMKHHRHKHHGHKHHGHKHHGQAFDVKASCKSILDKKHLGQAFDVTMVTD